MVEEARDLFEAAGEPHRARLARNELGYLAAHDGDPDAHEAAAREVLAEAEAADDRFSQLQALCSLVFALQWTGRVVESEEVMERASRSRAPRASGTASATCSASRRSRRWCAAARPRPRNASPAGRAANPSYRDTLLPDHEIMVAWLQGQLARAAEAGADLLDWSGGTASPRRMGFAFAAIAAAEIGDVETAAKLCTASEAVFQGRPFWLHREMTMWGRGVELAHRGDVDGARSALTDSLGEQVRAEVRAVRALRRRRPGRARDRAGQRRRRGVRPVEHRSPGPTDVPSLRACDDFVEGADLLVAADPERALPAFERARERSPAPAGRCSKPAGVLAARPCARNDRAASVQGLEAAIDLMTGAGDPAAGAGAGRVRRARHRRPSRAHCGRRPEALTKREREVAALAVDGLSAREIGQRLFIGERTVETHLANAYAKLGVRSRVELARRAPDLNLNSLYPHTISVHDLRTGPEVAVPGSPYLRLRGPPRSSCQEEDTMTTT